MTTQTIINVVAGAFGYSPQILKSHRREARLVRARWVAMYAMRHLLGYSYPHIARELGLKDHTTVMYGIAKIESSTDEAIVRLRDRVLDIAAIQPLVTDNVNLCVHRVTEQLGVLAGAS